MLALLSFWCWSFSPHHFACSYIGASPAGPLTSEELVQREMRPMQQPWPMLMCLTCFLSGLLLSILSMLRLLIFFPAGPLTFEDLIQREHEAIAAALAHADVPHIQVIAELANQQNLTAFNAIPYQVCIILLLVLLWCCCFAGRVSVTAGGSANVLSAGGWFFLSKKEAMHFIFFHDQT